MEVTSIVTCNLALHRKFRTQLTNEHLFVYSLLLVLVRMNRYYITMMNAVDTGYGYKNLYYSFISILWKGNNVKLPNCVI